MDARDVESIIDPQAVLDELHAAEGAQPDESPEGEAGLGVDEARRRRDACAPALFFALVDESQQRSKATLFEVDKLASQQVSPEAFAELLALSTVSKQHLQVESLWTTTRPKATAVGTQPRASA